MKTKLLKKLRKKHAKRYKIVKYKDVYRLYRRCHLIQTSHYLDSIKKDFIENVSQSIRIEVSNLRIKREKIIKFYPYG